MGYGSENTAHFLRELSQREDLTDGTVVIIRNTGQVPGYLGFLRGKPAFVISHPAGVYSAAKGSKRVVILPIGASEIIETEERWLKPERNLPAKRGDYSDIEEGDG